MQANSITAYEYLYAIEEQFTHEHNGINSVDQHVQQSLHFRVSGYDLLIELNTSTEVINDIDCSLIPRTQPWLLGMASLRGQLLPLIDLSAYWFDEAPAYKLVGKRVISTKIGTVLVGLVVDHVFGVANTADMEANEIKEKDWGGELMPMLSEVYTSDSVNYGVCDFAKMLLEKKFTSMQRLT